MRHAAHARHTAVARGERGFDRRQRKRAALGDLERHLARLFPELAVWHYLVDEPDRERLARRELGVHEPQLFRFFLADQVLEIPRAVTGVEASHHGPDLAEHRALFRDREIAHHLQHLPAADREAVDRRYHGLLQPINALVDFKRRQHTGVERAVLHAFLAPADAEELIAGAADHQYARACLAPDVVDAIADLVAHLRGEHVAIVRAIEREPADRAVLFVQDSLERHEDYLIVAM